MPLQEALESGEDVRVTSDVVRTSRFKKQWMFLEQEMAREKMDEVRGLACDARKSAMELAELWNVVGNNPFRKQPPLTQLIGPSVLSDSPAGSLRPAMALDWTATPQTVGAEVVSTKRQPRRRGAGARKTKLKAAKKDVKGPTYGKEANNMSRLFQHIGKSPLLSASEEKELAEQVQLSMSFAGKRVELAQQLQREPSDREWAAACGQTPEDLEHVMQNGQEAKEKMVHANMRLVVAIARRYANNVIGLDDLIAEGIFGLTKGVEKFDPSKGFKFSTYAHWWIRQAVVRSTTEQTRVIKVPIHLHELASRAKRKQEELEQMSGRTPSNVELAEALGVPEKRLERMWEAMKHPVALDAPSQTDNKMTNVDFVEDENAVEPEDQVVSQSMKEHLENVLDTLTPRESGIIRQRYGLDDGVRKTLEQVGSQFNITKERVRQIEAKAIRKLRHPARSNMLLEYAMVNPEPPRRPVSSILRKS